MKYNGTEVDHIYVELNLKEKYCQIGRYTIIYKDERHS